MFAPMPRILLVDDDALCRNPIRRYLQRIDFSVTEASGVSEAMQRILSERRPFDAILSDVQMIRVHGDELHRWVASFFPGMLPRFVFMTGGIYQDSIRQYLATTPHRLVEKGPRFLAEIEAVLREIVAEGLDGPAED